MFGRLSPSLEFPSPLPLLGREVFTVERKPGRGDKTQWIEWRRKRPGGKIDCSAKDNKGVNNGIIKNKEGDTLRNRQEIVIKDTPSTCSTIWSELMLQMLREREHGRGGSMTVPKGQRQLNILLIIWKRQLEPGNNCPFKIQKIQLMKFNEKAVEHIPLVSSTHPPSSPSPLKGKL